MQKFIILTEDDVQEIVEKTARSVVSEFYDKISNDKPDKLLSVNAVSKQLGISWSTAMKYIDQGKLIVTESGRVPESSIRESLKKQ